MLLSRYLLRWLCTDLINASIKESVDWQDFKRMRDLGGKPAVMFRHPEKVGKSNQSFPLDRNKLAELRIKYPPLPSVFIPDGVRVLFSHCMQQRSLSLSDVTFQNFHTFFQTMKADCVKFPKACFV